MNQVADIADFRPHIIIKGKTSVHVIPEMMFENIISGKLPLSEVGDLEDFLPAIIKEWLEGRRREGGEHL